MKSGHILLFCTLCLLSALAIGLTAHVTRPRIAWQRQRQLQASVAELIGPQSAELRWQRPPSAGPLRGYASLAGGEWLVEMVGSGYGGPLRLLAHFDHQTRLLGMKVVEQRETPGFGTRIARSWYQEVYLEDETIPQGVSDLPPDLVDVVSGATISFRAVARLLQQAAETLAPLVEDRDAG